MRRPKSLIRSGTFGLLAGAALLAVSLNGCSDDDNPQTPTPAPPAPTNVQATAGDTEVTVSWDDAAGATSYNLYYDTTSDVTTSDPFVAGAVSPQVHGSRTNGTTYYYAVAAVGAGGQSALSAVVSARPVGPPVYVASTGNDTNDGTQANPKLTFAAAYTLAQTDGRSAVRMEATTFTAPEAGRAIAVEIVGGIDLEGGFDVPVWTVGSSRTEFEVGTVAATANNITVATVISNVVFRASSQTTNANSIALYSTGSNNALQFDNCLFVGAEASAGGNGTAGTSGVPGGPGNPGLDGACDGPQGLGGGGGTGGAGGGCPGGAGGQGGLPGDNDGTAGNPGGCNGGIGGQAGFGGAPGSAGFAGGDGAAGFLGPHGTSASAAGTIDTGQWMPLVSVSGSDGSSGTGGGGGGGGGGGTANTGGGNGGGGGGGGGQGGLGGTGAGGGYGSFAVFLFDSSPTLTSCEFELGQGGIGGVGGNGGTGGDGGAAGEGAATCLGEIGEGGDGGAGGGGGAGGAGAGGPGGPSYGVYKAGTSVPVLTTPTFTTGTAGAGGAGGIREGTADQAPSGAAGITADTN